MHFSFTSLATLASIAIASTTLLADPVTAGTIGDTLSIGIGTALTAGLYLPWKAWGVKRRCKKDKYQDESSCRAQIGCAWNPDENECRAGDWMGWKPYVSDMRSYCAAQDKKACETHKQCYYSGWRNSCRVRYLRLFRDTSAKTEEGARERAEFAKEERRKKDSARQVMFDEADEELLAEEDGLLAEKNGAYSDDEEEDFTFSPSNTHMSKRHLDTEDGDKDQIYTVPRAVAAV